MTRSNIKNHFRNEKGVEPWRAIAFCKIGHFFLESDQAANATGKYDSYPIKVCIIRIDTRILHTLIACNNSNLSKTVNLPSFFSIEKICGFEIFYFAGKPCFKL